MDLTGSIIVVGILIFSAILHEVSHGFVAEKLGDPTARLSGRLTLNPLKHIDPMMSLLLPLMLILTGSPFILGGAKPVPVDPFNLRDGRKDLALVSLAGPLTNILLAIAASFIVKLILFANISDSYLSSFLLPLISTFGKINLLLAIFNLIPIPPLDGSKIFALLLSEKTANLYMSLGSIGIFIIIFLLFMGGEFSLGNLIYTLLSFSQKILGLY